MVTAVTEEAFGLAMLPIRQYEMRQFAFGYAHPMMPTIAEPTAARTATKKSRKRRLCGALAT